MKAVLLTLSAAIVVAGAAAPALAQLRPAPLPRGVMMKPVDVPSFASYEEFYAHVAKTRGVADPASALAVQQIESQASVDHLRDYSGDPIVVVKLDATRVGENATFFVLRQKTDHLALLGQMSARSYESTIARGHLEFVLDVGQRAALAPRYQVDGDFLINLADLASLDRGDPVALDVEHAF